MLAVCFMSILFSNCRKAAVVGTENCLDRIENVSNAASLYASDPTVDNCKNYLDALKKYFDSDACFGNVFFAQYRQALQELEESECE